MTGRHKDPSRARPGRSKSGWANGLQTEAHVAQLQRLLEDGRERLAEMYDFVPVALLTLDHAGIIREINLAGARLLGRERTNVLGMTLLGSVARGDRRSLRTHLTRCRRDAGTHTVDLCLAPKGADEVPVRVITRRAAADSREAFLTAIVDVTAARRLEEEHSRLAASRRAAQEASEAKDLFIAVLSHELRAPLSAISAAAALLDASNVCLPPELRHAGALIRRNVAAQSRLIDDLLDLTRLSRGIVQLRKAPADLHGIAEDAVETLAHELAGKGLLVVRELAASAHTVDGDAARLRQVLINLIKNAIKFTPTGGRIAVRSWNNGRKIVLEVSDTGIGFEPELAERLFAPYQQVNRGAGGGLGLGLAITRGIVELHGGTITASSQGPHRGARFVFELEAVDAVVPVAETAVASRSHQRRVRRILLVEDNADFAESLSTTLRAAGYEVERAPSCDAARRADLASIDLVLSDLQLPDGEGLDLMRELNAKRQVRAIALSGRSSDEDRDATLMAGFAAHFTKPVDIDALLGAIRSATQGQGRRGRRPLSRVAGRA
jgi:PAS domain S-box-containing protein